MEQALKRKAKLKGPEGKAARKQLKLREEKKLIKAIEGDSELQTARAKFALASEKAKQELTKDQTDKLLDLAESGELVKLVDDDYDSDAEFEKTLGKLKIAGEMAKVKKLEKMLVQLKSEEMNNRRKESSLISDVEKIKRDTEKLLALKGDASSTLKNANEKALEILARSKFTPQLTGSTVRAAVAPAKSKVTKSKVTKPKTKGKAELKKEIEKLKSRLAECRKIINKK